MSGFVWKLKNGEHFSSSAVVHLSANALPLWKLVLDFRKFFSPVLTELNLYENKIGGEGAKAIAEALKVNPLLKTPNPVAS